MGIPDETRLEAAIEDLTRQIDALFAKSVANWTIEETRKVNELTKQRAKARAELRDDDLDDQQDAAYQAAVDAGMFDQEVKFDLKAEFARIHADFCADRGIEQEPYRPTDAEREAVCSGYYSTMARGG